MAFKLICINYYYQEFAYFLAFYLLIYKTLLFVLYTEIYFCHSWAKEEKPSFEVCGYFFCINSKMKNKNKQKFKNIQKI